ncbi:MAG: shikimate kinase [Luteolibacter sp.]
MADAVAGCTSEFAIFNWLAPTLWWDMNNESARQMPRTLVLIGFMGSGKSTIGRKLHQQLGYQLIDTDQLIEAGTKKSIQQIFTDDGEESFRDLESAMLNELAVSPAANRIISTGGGVVLREQNRKLLRDLGFVVWLRASAKEIFRRTASSKHRPLLQTHDPEAVIHTMMTERDALYKETCHLEIDTADLDMEEACAGIMECASYHFKQCEQ